MLEIDIQKQLGNVSLDVQLSVPSDGICALFGRSGAGKTSLANIISGLIKPDQGRIVLNQKIVFDSHQSCFLAPEKRNIGYVFQDARLFPHYHVKSNLLYGASKEIKEKKNPLFDDVVQLLDIEPLLKRYPNSLSGGEKQRVAIGRAILSEPELLIMDEPLASLDLPRKREVMPYLERLAKKVKIPIIYVTHSLDEILRLADHMILLHQGKVSLSGDIATVWHSKEMRPWINIAEQSTLLEGKVGLSHEIYPMTFVELSDELGIWVNKIDAQLLGENIRLKVRANDVSLIKTIPSNSSIRNILPVTILDLEEDHKNDIVAVKLDLSGHTLWANITMWARDDLSLIIGQSWFAQIKGVSVTDSALSIE